jgi:myo-inositol-1(or 4)-monophosphatase
METYLAMLREVMTRTAGVRRAGSASLDLAYVAAGRLDGFWELGLSPWDMAAGSLLIAEAGGLVGDLEGNTGYMKSGHIVAGAPKVFVELLKLLASHRRPQEPANVICDFKNADKQMYSLPVSRGRP